MDFSFSEEQEMLRGQVRSFMSKEFPEERIVELAEREPGSALEGLGWPGIAELGWIGLSAPEEAGGAGMTFLDEAVVLEELGRGLYPGPYLSTVALALPALVGSEELAAPVLAGEDAATLAWAEAGAAHGIHDGPYATRASKTGDAWTLTGVKRAVPDAGSAGVFVVIADSDEGVGLWGVRGETDGVSVRELSTMDQTRRYGELRLDSTPAILLVPPGEASDVIHRTRLRAQAALAVEAVGLAQRALDLAKAHAAEREQFGKAIGSYQAVSHQVADTYMAVELARSLAYWAAWCVAESDPQAEVAAAAAKSFAAEAAVEACERSIQVHGGIGFTWEHILHRLYKRAQWIDGFDGFGRAHRETVATSLLGAPR